MMLDPAYVLVAMLRVGQPGHADLSRVYLPFDDDCSTECSDMFFRTRGNRPVYDYKATSAYKRPPQWLGWSIKETRQEGLDRYVTIARAISIVGHEPPPNWPRKESVRRVLVHLLITVSRHESAWWRGVHDGTHRGPAGEIGLFQVHPVLKEEFLASTAGVDIDSTLDQVVVAAELLGRFWSMCNGDTTAMFYAYGTGKGCDPPDGKYLDSTLARAATYNSTFSQVPMKVDHDVVLSLSYSQPGWDYYDQPGASYPW